MAPPPSVMDVLNHPDWAHRTFKDKRTEVSSKSNDSEVLQVALEVVPEDELE